jgi:predicted DNA-binding transcriptional regulator AlpA
MTAPTYVDMRRLCEHLCITERTVDAHVRTGELPPPYRLGGKRLWKWSEVERYIRKGISDQPSADPEAERIRDATRRAFATPSRP